MWLRIVASLMNSLSGICLSQHETPLEKLGHRMWVFCGSIPAVSNTVSVTCGKGRMSRFSWCAHNTFWTARVTSVLMRCVGDGPLAQGICPVRLSQPSWNNE